MTLAGSSATDEVVGRLEAERVQLYGDLQRCMYEIQQRDQFFQQLNTKVEAEPRFSDARLKTLVYFRKLSPSHLPPTLCLTLLCLQLQQTVEEKSACAAQLRAVSQTLRDTQNRCHWLENQVQVQAQVKKFVFFLVLSKYKTVLYVLRIGKTSVMSDVTTANLK